MSNITIRAARPNDLEELNQMMFDLHDEHHCQQPDLFKSAEEIEQEKSIARYLDDPECLVFVAECGEGDDAELVGFVTGHFSQLVSVVSQPVNMGSVDEFYVVPEERKQGIGRLLLNKMETTFKEYGVEQMFVEVWDSNRRAVSFYQSEGFNHHIHWLRKPL